MAISGTFYSDSFSWNSRKDEKVARRSTSVSCFGDDFVYPEKVLLRWAFSLWCADARADLARGRYVLPDYGFPFGVRPETDQCLRQHGLEVRVVGLDIMNDSERSYYSSYISVMNAAIAQKFSPDVFEQCCRYQPISLRTACRPVNE